MRVRELLRITPCNQFDITGILESCLYHGHHLFSHWNIRTKHGRKIINWYFDSAIINHIANALIKVNFPWIYFFFCCSFQPIFWHAISWYVQTSYDVHVENAKKNWANTFQNWAFWCRHRKYRTTWSVTHLLRNYYAHWMPLRVIQTICDCPPSGSLIFFYVWCSCALVSRRMWCIDSRC